MSARSRSAPHPALAGGAPRRACARHTALLALLVLSGCISERAEPLGLTPGVDCTLPLDSARIGNVGVVIIRNFRFEPAELRVQPGTKVTWVNCESEATQAAAHTSTADGGGWSSPLLQAGQAFTTELTASGTYAYHCVPHPSMRGTIIVAEP